VNPIANAPFREEVLDQIHEVAERITERVRHVLPAELALDVGSDPSHPDASPIRPRSDSTESQ
jgi:nitrogen-specific signal transduction histidine kinase